jgi:2-polyprenyl-3-methyl-5-hydroxy-6-metoxy-1,4-benzoquinol methylase
MVPYMWAAILIYPFWPSVVGHIAMFRDDFIRRLPKSSTVFELACGHGVLSLLAAEDRPDLQIEGSDISPPAIAVANRLLATSGHSGRVRFIVKDALNGNGTSQPKCQGLISAMLAEHLMDPKPLFRTISQQIAPEGVVYFSTALESPQRDHVFEFNHESEPLRMAEDVGLRVSRMVSDAGAVHQGTRFLPRSTAMILKAR